MSPSPARPPRVRVPRPAAALAAGLALALAGGVASASQDKPQVTNGGYLQTQSGDRSVALPLRHTDVQAEIAGMVSSVQVTQHFQNPYKKPIEAVYVFPLPHRAAIYEMTIRVGKRLVKGIVKKRAEARAIYDQARAAGKTAALLEQERPNIFTQSIANIMPGDDIKVALRYVEDLAPEDGRYEFVFPMVVGPRYVGGGEKLGRTSGTGWGQDTDRIPDASRITPHLLAKGLRPGNDIAVRLKINAGVKIQNVYAVAHKTQVSNTGTWASVVLDQGDSIPNKDFVVRYSLAAAQPEVAVLPQWDKRGGHFLLMIQPKAKMQQQDIAPREYIFVIDKSGSQYGFPLEQSKAVMRKCLATVGPRDTFNFIAFESGTAVFAPRAVPATQANVTAALSWIDSLSGGGGTEFIPALRQALTAAKDPARSRIVLFSTDGYIGYEKQVLKYLRDNAKGVNLFPLGVGSSVNRFLIDGMARIGVGRPFYLLNTEKPDAMVERFFSTISKPSLTSIEIDWGGLEVEAMTPSAVPDLFGEQPVFVAGRYRKGGSGTVTVRGRLAGRSFVKRVQVTLPTQSGANNTAVPYLWARRQIADLSDLGAVEPDRLKETEESITKTALKYNLMSQYTSMVAVDHVIRNQGGQQITVPVPVALPDGVSDKAAPHGAFVGQGMANASPSTSVPMGAYGVRYRAAKSVGGYGMAAPGRVARAEEAERAPAPLPVQPTVDAPATDRDDEKTVSRQHPRPPATRPPTEVAALTIRLRPDLRVSGSGNAAALNARLQRFFAALAPRITSVRAGQQGSLTLRLSLDAAGKVTRVAFVSGTLMRPSLKVELERALRALRLGALGGESTVTFTLLFG